jgi:hypothetical protein
MFFIKEILGFGQVNYYPKINSGTYILSDSNDIALLIHLFNGNLILPKRIKQLKEWLTVYRENPKNYDISLIKNYIKLSLKIVWISGFTNAEGCFNVHINRVEQRVGFITKSRFLLDPLKTSKKDSF